jgi:glutamate-ammonia-ligase adenylyltransferase
MDAAFTSIAFADAARAESNLALVEERLPGSLWPTLPALLAQVPDPDGALNYLERFLREAPPRVLDEFARNPAALHYALVIFSYSRVLSETLIQQPELVLWLCRAGRRGGAGSGSVLDKLKTAEDLHEEFARYEVTAFDLPPAVALARFKRREYLRIMLRDVLGLATLAETTLELSLLADVLLERALRICETKLERSYGTPQSTDPAGRRQQVRLTILSLGKLGGAELNYASDIDLMFLYAAEGETSGGASGRIANSEFFVRLAQGVLKLVTEVTPEGAVYRVDLRLRPQGAEGDLAISLPAALDYYRRRAREWELQMLIKARCSAGDAETARRFLREVQPLIFRREFHPAAVEAVLRAREEISRGLRRAQRLGTGGAGHEAQWNVKLSPGGIRDIEFLTQCLQRLHGGADPWVSAGAAGSTLVALQRLHDKGYLSGRDFFRLGTAYQFLRRVEHRLQLRDGIQRHTLPSAPDALERLARRCGVEAVLSAPPRSAGEQLLQRIAQHFAEVREIYNRVVSPAREPAEAGGEVGGAAPGALTHLQRLAREYPSLARAVSEAGAHADKAARRGLERYLDSAALEPEVLRELDAHPEWLLRATEIFARSDFAAELLARHPAEISAFAGAPPPAPAKVELPAESFEQALAALRISHRRGLLVTMIRALSGQLQPFQTFEELTCLADEALSAALRLAARETLPGLARDSRADPLRDAPFAALALGRLGTREMDIGSDADLVFVAHERLTPEEREPWRRLAERFVHVVSSHTREGLLFPVDTRLRPRGAEGEIVPSRAYLRDYFAADAQAWEAITWLKARPVAGNFTLGAAAIAEVHSIARRRFADAAALARQLSEIRERLEKPAGAARAKGEFKKIPGGYYDIDYLAGFLFLSRGVEAGAGGHIVQQIAALESARALDSAGAQTLRAAALLYRSMDHALRLITGHAAHRVPDSVMAGRVARLLEQWGVPLSGGLAESVKNAQAGTRALYERLLLATAEASGHPAGPPAH